MYGLYNRWGWIFCSVCLQHANVKKWSTARFTMNLNWLFHTSTFRFEIVKGVPSLRYRPHYGEKLRAILFQRRKVRVLERWVETLELGLRKERHVRWRIKLTNNNHMTKKWIRNNKKMVCALDTMTEVKTYNLDEWTNFLYCKRKVWHEYEKFYWTISTWMAI